MMRTSRDAKIAFFDKLHRFIRLYKATGWSIYQLDVVLASFGATDIGIDELILTYKTGKLANKYTIQPEIMIILWSDISTTRYINFDSAKQDELPSVYDRFFRNRSMVNPPDPNFDDPASITGTLEVNRATILAAYNISESDLYMASDHDLDIATNIENLSGIYRKVLAYQCSKRTSYAIFKDQLDTLGLELPVGTVPEVAEGWEHLFMSLDAADYTPFSWPELKYLFRHQDTDNQFIDSDSLIQSFYEALRLELNKALNNFDLDLDPVEHPEVIDVKARLSKLTVQQYAAYFELDFSVLHYLLTEVIQIGTTPGFAIDILITNDFINSVLPITRDQAIGNLDFEDLYHTYFTIDKLALLSEDLIISPDLIIFMQEHHAALTTLDILDLPVLPVAEGDPDLIRAFFSLQRLDRAQRPVRMER
ncbi:MAG: hypothetical protein KL787_09035 [Taibaiella sp.]|nr:hypothetical protein [Taibaiella sp.]